MLYVLNIILISILIFISLIIIRKFVFVKNFFIKSLNFIKYYKKSLIYFIRYYYFNYKLKKKYYKSLINRKNMGNLLIFFQFGSKKHSYFKIWFNNLKRKKYWIWKWRN